MAKEKGLTPMMQQFFDLKAKHPDALLLFRCGDFYETYCEDAVTASQILGITLTKRNNGAGVKGDEMAGFPHHALDTYLPKLIRAGKRVAICDQLEDPKLTKKLVKRGITELVTPGVALSDTVLNNKENNFLASVYIPYSTLSPNTQHPIGIAFLDISTGEFMTGEGPRDYVEKLLGSFQPKEVLFERDKKQLFMSLFDGRYSTFAMDDWVFTEQTARQKLQKHFGTTTLKGFGVDHLKNGVVAAGAILQYLELTLHQQIGHITSLSRIEQDKYVRLDKFTIRSLELVQPMHEEGSSLLQVIDRTVTPMGGRLLRRWMVFPLKDEKLINERLDGVEYFFRHTDFRDVIDESLRRVGDLERVVSKVATGRVTPREMMQLKTALEALQPVKEACMDADIASIKNIGNQLDLCEDLRDKIDRELEQDPPQQIGKGNVIRDGVNSELDELRSISRHGKDYLMRIQEREVEQTGISSLKIGYNNVFGYYLEVRNTYKDKVPADWIRKQTLAQADRYITPEL